MRFDLPWRIRSGERSWISLSDAWSSGHSACQVRCVTPSSMYPLPREGLVCEVLWMSWATWWSLTWPRFWPLPTLWSGGGTTLSGLHHPKEVWWDRGILLWQAFIVRKICHLPQDMDWSLTLNLYFYMSMRTTYIYMYIHAHQLHVLPFRVILQEVYLLIASDMRFLSHRLHFFLIWKMCHLSYVHHRHVAFIQSL